ncbi:MAG: anion transporter [Candidatus Binatia bacterium]|nr:anion transporter [Candidatus Binatia bacterium]
MDRLTLALFLVSYALLAVGGLPPFRFDRTGIAIMGAAAMLLTGAIPLDAAVEAVDYRTLIFLFGMMIVVANLRLAGFFRLVTAGAVARARSPRQLLAVTVFVPGILAAFFINDVVCLVCTPLVLQVAHRLRLPPTPYLLALATAANIGSAATISGNPQNMLVASFARVPYADFALHLAPLAAAGLVVDYAILRLLFRRELYGHLTVPATDLLERRVHKPLLYKSSFAALLTVSLFFAGYPVAEVSLGVAAWLLATRRVRPEKIYREIDWPLLVLFIGLFVIVGAVEHAGIDRRVLSAVASIHHWGVAALLAATAALSNLVSNVPAVMLLKPAVVQATDPTRTAMLVAAASTFAGNLLTIGSVANLIVLEQARRAGIAISFWQYARVGIPVTLATLTLTVLTFAYVYR